VFSRPFKDEYDRDSNDKLWALSGPRWIREIPAPPRGVSRSAIRSSPR